MAKPLNTAKFSVSVVGSVSNETIAGDFEAKTRLTQIDRLNQDAMYRRYLGSDLDPQQAGPGARLLALKLSELAVRLTTFPDWWRVKGMGELLEDDNVLDEVFTKAVKAEADFLKALREKAAASQQTLRDQGALGDGQEG
jgi:hypothetical protein